jgi:hypothetical protein
MGSFRRQLITQFFTESFLVVMLAFMLSMLIVYFSLPSFNALTAKEIIMPWSVGLFWRASIIFIVVTSFLSGCYPALFLSSFQPVKVLKGSFSVARFSSLPRKVLVVVQFTVSIVLITGTIAVFRQIDLGMNRPVGYTREGLIMMKMKSADFYGKDELLRHELKATGAVEEMSQSMGRVTDLASGNNGFEWPGKDPNFKDSFGTLAVSPEHGKTVGWQFVDGRDFSRDIASDSTGMVINESAAKYMGLQNPVGQPVRWKWWSNGAVIDYKILGVVKDIVMESPYDPVEPTVFYLKGHNGKVNWINIRLNPSVPTAEALTRIETVFKKIIPSAPFDYEFVDEDYARKFASVLRTGRLVLVFSVLAIFISCLGLFGLASFVAEQRTKEIGVRKVLGASVTNLWRMLSKDFVILVMLAAAIATPLSIYLLTSWLENYQYRIALSWQIFAASAMGSLLITLITVSYQAIKAALANPVNSLKSE